MTINKLEGIVVGQYGIPIEFQVIDADGNPKDLSTYTGKSIRAVSPDAQKTLTFTGTFSGGGTDGKVNFTPTVSNTFDREGTWEAQAEFTKTNVVTLTVPFDMVVEKKI